ncbi:MAG: hypothetical protein JWN32_3246 [Solirubrobacterales bacterium]|nr:hypothetical protein [Solirubrobacterales bacterium]
MTARRLRIGLAWAVGLALGGVAVVLVAQSRQHHQTPLPPITLSNELPPGDPLTLQAPDLAVGPAPAFTPRGATAINLLHPKGPQPVVIFLHGWGAVLPQVYGAWLAHLARKGYFVIYPEYQGATTAPSAVLDNALAGIRGALKLGRAAHLIKPGPVVVAGHSGGATLAADYAALAAKEHLPPARAVFSVYPGVRLAGWHDSIPVSDLSQIPSTTKVVVLAGATDAVVGQATARRILGAAPQVPSRKLTVVTAAGVSDHGGPAGVDDTAQRTFWAPLDALLTGG